MQPQSIKPEYSEEHDLCVANWLAAPVCPVPRCVEKSLIDWVVMSD